MDEDENPSPPPPPLSGMATPEIKIDGRFFFSSLSLTLPLLALPSFLFPKLT